MEQGGKNIFEYVEIFYRRKWILIVPTVLFTIVAAVIAYRMPSYYRSSTLIIIEGQQIPEAYVKPTDRTPLASRLSTLSQQIMSRTRLEKIVEDFNLYSGEGASGASRVLHPLSSKKTLTDKEEAIEQMRKDIEVKVLAGGAVMRGGFKDADAFTVSYTSQDPKLAMKVTNTLASLFIEENLKIREQYAEGTSEFLVSELDKAKAELEGQEQALRSFKEKHMGSLPEQLDANLRTLDRLQLELQTVSASIKNTEDRVSLLEGQLGVGPGGATDSISAKELELAKLRKELSTLLSIYKESYPDVAIVKNRIKEVESSIKEMRVVEAIREDKPGNSKSGALSNPTVFSDLSAARSDLALLKKRSSNIRGQIRRYERRVEEIPGNEQKLADIKRDYDISLQNYKSLLEKKLSARLAENLEKRQKGERFRVVDPANLPMRPFKPVRSKILGQGAMVGAGLGVALVLLLEFLNPAFRRPEDISKTLPYPVLTTIPGFTPRVGNDQQRRFLVVKGRKGQKHA